MDTELGPININLWDTAGQERYQSLVPMYSKSSSVAIFVFDQSEKINFQALDDMIARAKRDTPEDCEIILVGNKMLYKNGPQPNLLSFYLFQRKQANELTICLKPLLNLLYKKWKNLKQKNHQHIYVKTIIIILVVK